VSGAGVQGDERAVGAGADVAGKAAHRGGQVGERARSTRGVVGGAQQHRSGTGRAVYDGSHGRARSFEQIVHVRIEDGNRRDEEVARGGFREGVADGDRDGSGDEGAGGRHVGATRAGRGWREAMSGGVAREGQTFSGGSRLVRYANFVKLPHTLFALPFALVGVTVASYVKDVRWIDVLWVAIAFTAARFAAMGFNRIADRHIDALNVRTAARELPSGAMTVREASLAVLAAC